MMSSHSKKKRETKQVDQKHGMPSYVLYPRTQASLEMANKLGINRSAVSKHLKKMQDNDIIHRDPGIG